MTSQHSELFEYRGKEYNIIGMQGASLIPAEDLIIKIPTDTQSTGLYRGYQGTYAVDEQSRLMLKYAAMPHVWKKTIDQPVPMTGYILFSNDGDPWLLAMNKAVLKRVIIFEAEIVEGVVVSVTSHSTQVWKRLQALTEIVSPFEGDFENQEDTLRRAWDWTTRLLPRRYDVLRLMYNYFHFPTMTAL